MDTFLRWIDRLIQQIAWESLSGRVQWVDWVLVFMVIGGVAYGGRRGLMREIVEILELFLMIFATFGSYPLITRVLQNVMRGGFSGYTETTAFTLTAMAFWVTTAFIDGYLKKFFRSQLPARIRNAGGSLLGILHFILLWSFISQVFLSVPVPFFQEPYTSQKSISGRRMAQLAPKIYEAMTYAIR